MTPDRLLLTRDLAAEVAVSVKTVARWRRDGKLPPPDVDQSQRTRGWLLSTLRAHGLNLPDQPAAHQASPPMPAASLVVAS